ncbi:MAG: CRISPR system precrRNA processing endoribonuclease RAMP protein Cas6, partial [Anaerolineales bacterium]
MFSLTLTHLRFTLEALTPIRLDGWRAGSNLRGALGNVMRRAYCAGDFRDPAHTAACPVCWLLAANEHPGEERRGYALVPPLNPPDVYRPGERFPFGLTLFGSALRSLPYFVLAVPEMGRVGVGAGRGQFALRQVWAADPLRGEFQCVLAEGDSLVHAPALMITHDDVLALTPPLERSRLQVNFLTPMRLVEDERLLKIPDFGVFFARLLKRLDELEAQFALGEGRPLDDVFALQALADRVRLMEADTRWVEVWSGSARTGQKTPLSGFVGAATYSAPPEVWQALLPWLAWGQGTQVGKDVVKGNGWYELVAPGLRRYGHWPIANGRSQLA